MKKILIVVITAILVISCQPNQVAIHSLEIEFLTGEKDTISVIEPFNNEVKTFIASSEFNEQSINSIYELIDGHKISSEYDEALNQYKKELIDLANNKRLVNTLFKLENNTLKLANGLPIPELVDNVKSFRILSTTGGGDIIPVQSKLMQLVNNATVEELDVIPWVRTQAAENIKNARPITSISQLKDLPYVTENAISRMETYAKTWINPNPETEEQLKPKLLDKTNWEIKNVSSEESHEDGGYAKHILDNDPETIWHTEWKFTDPSHPHSIEIDLKDTYTVSEIQLLPRQDQFTFGEIKEYKIYFSDDGVSWGLIDMGELAFTKDLKKLSLDSNTRYIKLVSLSSHNGVWASLAELNLIGIKK